MSTKVLQHVGYSQLPHIPFRGSWLGRIHNSKVALC